MGFTRKLALLFSLVVAAFWGAGCSSDSGNNPVGAEQAPKTTQGDAATGEECETCSGAEDADRAEEAVAVDDLPAAVVSAVLAAVPGGEIDEAERALEDGVVVYDVGVIGADGGFEVEVTEAGEVLLLESDGVDDEEADGDEEEVAVDDLPAAVVSAVLAAVPGGEIDEAERALEDGVVVYDVEVESADGDFEVEVTEAGEVLLIESEDDDDDEDDDDED